MKKSIFILGLFFSYFSAFSQQPEIYTTDGKAINGYDVVAFFKASKPIKGSDSLSYTWKEAKWLFSSKENLDSFVVSPEKYAPQFGGYCAYGCSQGHKAPTDVNTFTIFNNKLYFNYNKDVQQMWQKDQQALIDKANKTYPQNTGTNK